MVIFMIGSSTAFPQTIAEYLGTAGHDVHLLGRDTLDYAYPALMEKHFETLPSPDIVVFNQQVAGGEVSKYSRNNKVGMLYLDNFEKFKRINDKNLTDSFYGKLAIYDILKDCKQFVFISSSITLRTNEYGFRHLAYRYLRAAEQQLIKCIALEEGKTAYGLCPGGMDLNPEKFAIATAKIINGELEEDEYVSLNSNVTLVSSLQQDFLKE
jgi:NAD(P)-dependent dehydrogenase (short-subunit alcohol dehydrogenase family)